MSAPGDTAEAVERKASILGTMALYNFGEGSAGRDNLNNAAAMLRRLHQRAVEAERERDGASALVERMHAQDVLAIKAWHKANPGNDLIWPDHMRLSAWCMGEVARLTAALAAAHADALREGFMLARDVALGALSPSDGAVYAADFKAQMAAHNSMERVKAKLEEAADANGIHPTTTGET